MKKQIALVSVTLNAVNPMTEYLSGRDPELHLVNYLDSYLLEKVGTELSLIPPSFPTFSSR